MMRSVFNFNLVLMESIVFLAFVVVTPDGV